MTGRPSLFLEEVQRIAAKVGVSEDLVKHKFIQALPTSIGGLRSKPMFNLPRVIKDLSFEDIKVPSGKSWLSAGLKTVTKLAQL